MHIFVYSMLSILSDQLLTDREENFSIWAKQRCFFMLPFPVDSLRGFRFPFGYFRFCVLLGSLGLPRLLWVCLSETFSEMKQDREFIHFWAKMLNCLFLDSFPARFLFFPPFLGMSFDVIWFLTFEETTTLLWLGFTERLS